MISYCFLIGSIIVIILLLCHINRRPRWEGFTGTNIASVQVCQDKCSLTQGCDIYKYDANTKTCQIMQKTPSPNPAINYGSIQSNGQFLSKPGTIPIGVSDTIGAVTTNEKQCAGLCISDPTHINCDSYTYNTNTNYCSLFSHGPNVPGITTGIKSRTNPATAALDPVKDTIIIPETYTAPPEAHEYKEYQSDFNQTNPIINTYNSTSTNLCRMICDGNPNCEIYQHDDQSNTCYILGAATNTGLTNRYIQAPSGFPGRYIYKPSGLSNALNVTAKNMNVNGYTPENCAFLCDQNRSDCDSYTVTSSGNCIFNKPPVTNTAISAGIKTKILASDPSPKDLVVDAKMYVPPYSYVTYSRNISADDLPGSW